jgi:hypothetical protein
MRNNSLSPLRYRTNFILKLIFLVLFLALLLLLMRTIYKFAYTNLWRPVTLSGSPTLALSPPADRRVWRFSAGELRSYHPDQAAVMLLPTRTPSEIDLDGDGAPETFNLSNGRLEIGRVETPAWRSPVGWEVTQAAPADLNRDALPEAVLLVWRAFQPWPIDRYLPHPGRIDSFHDSAGRSCHLILIGWKEGAYRELWAGSALADPLHAFAAADLDGDGHQELIALEAAYTDPPGSPARALTAWEWNGFGFTLLDRVKGAFQRMQISGGQDGQGDVYIETE